MSLPRQIARLSQTMRAVGLVTFAIASGAGLVHGQAATDEQQIRARRESSNAAIARHDTAGIGAILSPNVIVVTSNSIHRESREANIASFADQFRTRPDVVYRRTPGEVRVFMPWLMASESGRWTGSWTDPDGKIELTGSYFAKWRKIGGEWLVESETYVPETCTGGAYCARVP
ncbi:MAG: nuclear transport factor 2 family protein [Acidobacteria bacterium]|nr:nuclear transport factor 2 family protein [Acidobacteriota bacterium]